MREKRIGEELNSAEGLCRLNVVPRQPERQLFMPKRP